MGRAGPGSTAHSTPAALARSSSSQKSGTCARVLGSAPQRSERPQGCSGDRGAPISVPPRPVKKSGQRWRERAARPLPTGGSATVGCGRRLCCIRGCALRSAQPRSDPEPARAAVPSSSAAARRAAPRGETRVRASFPALTDFRGRRISPRSLRASRPLSPSSRGSPTPWARARTHTHSHSQARVRTPARPEPRSLQRPSADPTLGRRYSHRLPAATGRPPSAAAAAEAVEGTAAAARPRLAAPCPGRSPGEAEKEDAAPRRSRAAPGARLQGAGCLRSRFRGPR